MKSTFSRRYLTKFTKRVKSCIALVFGLCSAFLPFSASGSDDTASIVHIKGTLDILNEYIQTDQYQMFLDWKADELQALGQVVPAEYQDRVLKTLAGVGLGDTFQWSDTDNVRAYLQALTRAFYGSSSYTTNPLPGSLLDYQRKQFARLGQVLSTLEALTNSSSSASTSRDVLAGNPWWATNSQFAVWHYGYDGVYPDDAKNQDGRYSFPQFLSLWSARLQTRSAVPTVSDLSDWSSLYGHDYFTRNFASSSNAEKIRRGYTWFDWVSDAMRSNWVLQATAIDLLSGLSNSPAVSSPDYLAGNPWWATNSGFVTDYYRMTRNGAYPPSAYPHDSFPVFASQLAATIYQPNISDYPYSSDYMTRWGRGGANWNNGVYTWFDWVADYLRSNLVLTTSYSETNLVEELYQAGYDVDQSVTNVPLPQYSLPAEESIPEAESALASGQSAINDLIDNLPKPSTGGNAEIVVIPEFSVGGIHVPEYRASLNSSIVPVAHSVLSFLYSVGVACFIFTTAKGEYLFYASLGRMWGSHGYDPSAS